MLTPEILRFVDSSVLCWLATVSQDGQPNVSPKEIFTYYKTDHLLVANIMSPQTIKNIKANPKVAISFIDVLVQKGYQIKGQATIITKKDAEFDAVHQPLFDMAGPNYPILSVIKIKITSTKPIIAPRYILFPETTEAAQIESA